MSVQMESSIELIKDYTPRIPGVEDSKPFTHIAHVSDIHIGSRLDRYQEYNNVFDTFAKTMKESSFKDTLLIVMTGDIYNWKSRLAPEDITCFNRLISNLYPLPILIIPGNHDAVLNNKNREDLLSPLVSHYRHVVFSKNTEVFTIRGLKFFHISVFDSRPEPELYNAMLAACNVHVDAIKASVDAASAAAAADSAPKITIIRTNDEEGTKRSPTIHAITTNATFANVGELRKDIAAIPAPHTQAIVTHPPKQKTTNEILEEKIKGIREETKPILLYHGFVDGAKMGSHTVSSCAISRRIMELSKITLVGDIHESQFIYPHAAYAGSLIQQNVGEDAYKGFILWSVEKNRGRFIEIPNRCIMVRVDYRKGQEGIRIYDRMTRGMSEEDKKMLLKNITRVTIITQSYGLILKQQVDEVKATFGRLDNISTVDGGIGSRSDSILTNPEISLPADGDVNGVNITTSAAGPLNATDAADVAKQNIINAVMAASAQLSPLETQIATIKQLLKDKADKLIPDLAALVTITGPGDIKAVEQLTARGAKIADITNKIVALHREYMTDQPIRKWSIKSMKWDNVLIYGPGNYIDFRSIANRGSVHDNSMRSGGVITGCIAPNRSGKSSIFDILVYALFGEHLRGDKKSIFHRGSSTLAVRVDFEVNDVSYYIERVDQRNKSSTIKLCKFNSDGRTEDLITGESIPDTYAKMRQLIGTLDEFLATGLFYDNENDIVRLGRKARRETLSKLFGLINNDNVIKEEKKKLKDLNAKLHEIETRFRNKLILGATGGGNNTSAAMSTTEESFNTTLTDVEEKLLSHKSQLTAAEKRQNELKKESGALDAEWYATSAEIKDIKDSLKSLNEINMIIKMQMETLAKKESRMRDLKNMIRVRVVELPSGMRSSTVRPLTEQTKKEYSTLLASELLPSQNSVSGVDKLPEYCLSWRSQLADTENELKGINERIIAVFGDNKIANANAAVDANAEIASAEKQIADCNAKLIAETAESNKLIAATNELLTQMTSQQSNNGAQQQIWTYHDLSTAEVATWNSELLNSIISTERTIRGINLDLHKSNIMAAERAVSNAESRTQYKFNDGCSDCTNNMRVLNNDLMRAKEELAKRIAEAESATSKHNAEEEKLARLESKRKGLESIVASMRAVDAGVAKIKNLNADIANYTTRRDKFQKCAAELSNRVVLEKYASTLQEKINAADGLYNDYLRAQYILTREEIDLATELPKINADVTAAREKLTKYENKGKSLNAAEEKLTSLTTSRTATQTSIVEYSELIGQLKLLIDDLEDFIAVKKEYDASTPQLRADIELHTIYLSLLGAKGLQTQVIKRNIYSVVSKINAVLSSITTFRLAVDVSDAKIDLFISDSVAGDLTKDIPIELASGFQKFVISLIFRLSLTHSLFTSSRFVICDESFSTFDQNNLMHVPDLLNAVKEYYDFIFIISHIEVLQQCIEVPIYISLEEKLELVSSTSAGSTGIGKERKPTNSDSVANIITSKIVAPEGAIAPVYTIPIEIKPDLKHIKTCKEAKAGGSDTTAVPAAATKITCECGAIVQKRSLATHKQSAKHLAALATNVVTNAINAI